MSKLHCPTDVERIAVTISGMSAPMIATLQTLGASVDCVPLAFGRGWQLDLERPIDALTPGARVLCPQRALRS